MKKENTVTHETEGASQPCMLILGLYTNSSFPCATKTSRSSLTTSNSRTLFFFDSLWLSTHPRSFSKWSAFLLLCHQKSFIRKTIRWHGMSEPSVSCWLPINTSVKVTDQTCLTVRQVWKLIQRQKQEKYLWWFYLLGVLVDLYWAVESFQLSH